MTNFVKVSDGAWVNADEVTNVEVWSKKSDPQPWQSFRHAFAELVAAINHPKPEPRDWYVSFFRGQRELRIVKVASESEGEALAQRFAREAAEQGGR